MKKTEIELHNQFISELSKESKDNIVFDKLIKVGTRGFTLDFISKTDYTFLQKIFNEIEKKTSKVDFEAIQKSVEKEIIEMSIIQTKKYITVKEFTKKYNKSKTAQQTARGRLYDPLPYHQQGKDCMITYDVSEVDIWIDNQNV